MPEETVLIQPLPVERNTDGWWSNHPNYLSEFDDEITEAQFPEWCLRHQVETKVTFMESDVCVDVFDTYMDDRQCDIQFIDGGLEVLGSNFPVFIFQAGAEDFAYHPGDGLVGFRIR